MSTNADPKVTVGLDVGDQYVAMCWLDGEGQGTHEQVRTTEGALRKRFEKTAPCRVVLEVGTHSPWISRLLKGMGHQVIVANARRVRLIADAEDKDDPADAELLARLGRVDPKLLRAIQHRSVEVQIDLGLLRSRDLLVRARSAMITHVRGVVKSVGRRLGTCSAEDPKRFKDSRGVGPYLGLCRKRRKSGDRDPQLGVTKAGDPFLRRLLVQCAQHLLGPFGADCDLRQWGLRLADGGRGAKKRAVIAVARKLAVLLHHLWVTEQDYTPFRKAKPLAVPA